MSISPVSQNKSAKNQSDLYKQNSNLQKAQMNKTLQGVLVNTYIKNTGSANSTAEDTNSGLFISDDFIPNPIADKNILTAKQTDNKNSLLKSSLPYAASALLATGLALALSRSYVKSQKLLKPGNVPTGLKLPTLGKNFNLRSEEYFAVYMLVSEPNAKNALALLGVFAMSALTLVGKTLVDGIRKVWTKKQEADIKKDFEEKSIEIETQSFSGKLDVIRQELSEKSKYFKSKLDNKRPNFGAQNNALSSLPPVFTNFLGFRGNSNNTPDNEYSKPEFKERVRNFYDKFKNSPAALASVLGGTLLIMLLGGRKVFSNMGQAARIREEAAKVNKEKIEQSIKTLVSGISGIADETVKKQKVDELKCKLVSIEASPERIKNVFEKLGFGANEISKVTDEISDDIYKIKLGDKFYVQADPAMGGKEGTQFYIYIDQAKGYIYDVITHPENKFARYIFSAITATGAAGWVLKESIDAIKDVAVLKENNNTEIDLKKRLVDTEIRNFKAKKESAITPLMQEFDTKLNSGASKAELKAMADNILFEIKNGPPFVYS